MHKCANEAKSHIDTHFSLSIKLLDANSLAPRMVISYTSVMNNGTIILIYIFKPSINIVWLRIHSTKTFGSILVVEILATS